MFPLGRAVNSRRDKHGDLHAKRCVGGLVPEFNLQAVAFVAR
jgi:hypothetical protein